MFLLESEQYKQLTPHYDPNKMVYVNKKLENCENYLNEILRVPYILEYKPNFLYNFLINYLKEF
jgi:hypothetical protein